MTKISKQPAYPIKTNIVETDYIPGTDSEILKLTTKSFLLGDIRDFVLAGTSPEEGGVLKITELTDNSGTYDTPSQLLNSLLPNYTVLRYHLLIVTVNYKKWIFKIQNTIVGSGQTAVSDSDFIAFPVANLQDLQSVLTVNAFASLGDTSNGISQHNMGSTGLLSSFRRILSSIDKNNLLKLREDEVCLESSVQTVGNDSTKVYGGVKIINGLISFFQKIGGDTGKTTQVSFNNPTANTVLKYPAKNSDGEYTIATLVDIPTYDGSETKINPTGNITRTGTGTTGDPYIIGITESDIVHKSGPETITGVKTINNATSPITSGFVFNNSNDDSSDNAGGTPLRVVNNLNAIGFHITNKGLGKGQYIFNTGAGNALHLDSKDTSDGNLMEWSKGFVVMGKIDSVGNLTAPRFNASSLSMYPDNLSAITDGLSVGDFYRTGTGVLMIVY